MADYKITEDSLKEENGQLRCMVTFYDDDGNESAEQFYEVKGNSQDALHKALVSAAQGYAKTQQGLAADEGKSITVGSKVKAE